MREDRDEVKFLYKVAPGAAQKSYGLYVAQIAGLPDHVVQRARELVNGWRGEPLAFSQQREFMVAERNGCHEPHAIIEKLSRIDPLHTTPMEALGFLADLKKLAESGGK